MPFKSKKHLTASHTMGFTHPTNTHFGKHTPKKIPHTMDNTHPTKNHTRRMGAPHQPTKRKNTSHTMDNTHPTKSTPRRMGAPHQPTHSPNSRRSSSLSSRQTDAPMNIRNLDTLANRTTSWIKTTTIVRYPHENEPRPPAREQKTGYPDHCRYRAGRV